MITLIIILVMLAAVLAIALAVSLKNGTAYSDEEDRDYRDQDGNHFYYDESIIEKKRFNRLHPKEAARTFRRLFKK